MRYPPEHKTRARRHLVRTSAQLAKASGFAATGLQAFVSAAGVTTGAFYSQFTGKPELLAAIVEEEFERVLTWWEGKTLTELLRSVDLYLSRQHVDQPAQGCPIPALAAEVARSDDTTRETFASGLARVHHLLTLALGDSQKAWALLCEVVGAVLIARAVNREATRSDILESVRCQIQQSLETP